MYRVELIDTDCNLCNARFKHCETLKLLGVWSVVVFEIDWIDFEFFKRFFIFDGGVRKSLERGRDFVMLKKNVNAIF